MYLREIIEVAMGVIFAWLLISLATMQVQEIIARIFKKRARDLEKAIGNLLTDPEKVLSSSTAQTMLKQFYEHPLIQNLQEPLNEKKSAKAKAINKIIEQKGEKNLSRREKWKRIRVSNLPSYIPPETFSTVLFDIITKAGTENSPIQSTLNSIKSKLEKLEEGDQVAVKAGLERIVELGKIAATTEVGDKVQKEIKKELKKQVHNLHKQYEEQLPQLDQLKARIEDAIDDPQINWEELFTSTLLVDRINTGIQNLLDDENTSKLGTSLRSLFAGINEYATNADHAIAAGRQNVEKWFDNSMDRLSGWYKRWSQKVAFMVALVIAGFFNVDSLYMVQEFWHNPALREASSAYIQNFIQENADEGDLDAADLTALQTDLVEINFPAGWYGIPEGTELTKDTLATWIFWRFWLLKLIGWLVTAAAAMQGAPFWFDILKKLVNIRSAGTNPKEKEKEAATA